MSEASFSINRQGDVKVLAGYILIRHRNIALFEFIVNQRISSVGKQGTTLLLNSQDGADHVSTTTVLTIGGFGDQWTVYAVESIALTLKVVLVKVPHTSQEDGE